jgi:DNA-binding GntR family transcriptional regulator
MLVDAWHYPEGRSRMTIAAGPEQASTMRAFDRHQPIIDTIENGDPPVAVAVFNDHMAAGAAHFSRVSG